MNNPGVPTPDDRGKPKPAHALGAALLVLAGLLPCGGSLAQEREPMSGQEVYNRFCGSCHNTGIEETPRFGVAEEWQARIANGRETVYKNAIQGIRGMPPKGGIAALFDQEVRDTVDFIVQSVGGWPGSE